MKLWLLILTAFLFAKDVVYSQVCTEPGQTASTAFSVCKQTIFVQTTVPPCQNGNVFVPGCSVGDFRLDYIDKNPFFYRFVCSTTGTLGLMIDPNTAVGEETEDFDWQIWDITGRNPEDIYTDTTLVVAGNWAGSYGTTGTTPTGLPEITCATYFNRYAMMPTLLEGHEYLLMVSHFTFWEDDGYTLKLEGGTAVINDSAEAHMLLAKPTCDNSITVSLNKKLLCSTLTPSGSEFKLSPANATILSATSESCSAGSFYLDEVTLTLSNPLTEGNYELIIDYGDDGNTLLDDCGRAIANEQIPFRFNTVQPVFADSIGYLGCGPDSLQIYFPKNIKCNSIAADGSDFVITGSSAVTILSATGNCVNGLSQVVTVRLSAPITSSGDYALMLTAGTDGTRIVDECEIEMPQQSLSFHTEEPVSALFNYSSNPGCRVNTLTFSHDGAHNVKKWNWTFNDSTTVNTQTHTIIFPATSTNHARLMVTNGTCSDTADQVVSMDNEVMANFEMPVETCPEDPVQVVNTSSGRVDKWKWNFANMASSDLKDPSPQYFPQRNRESVSIVKLIVTNNTVGCSDSVSKTIKVFGNCMIAVPSAFTPNNDGLNDFLHPNNALKALDLEFKVFNRWGQMVFLSRNWQGKWDGKVNGAMQPPGTFVWYLSYTHSVTGQKIFNKGTTLLIR